MTFPPGARDVLEPIAQQWAEQLIASGDGATRNLLSSVADLVGHFPSVTVLPTLSRLLDDELRRYRNFRQQAEAGQSSE